MNCNSIWVNSIEFNSFWIDSFHFNSKWMHSIQFNSIWTHLRKINQFSIQPFNYFFLHDESLNESNKPNFMWFLNMQCIFFEKWDLMFHENGIDISGLHATLHKPHKAHKFAQLYGLSWWLYKIYSLYNLYSVAWRPLLILKIQRNGKQHKTSF